jgi:S-adenosylmethionine/arginine decarboxylase-like enzyme
VFMCGEAKPHLAIEILRQEFQADEVIVKEHKRGEEMDQINWKAASAKQAPVRIVIPAAKAKKAA